MKHIHRYKRVRGVKSTTYMCTHPDCTHTRPKKYLHEKRASCNGCGEEFLLDSYALQTALPKCVNCRQTKGSKQRKKMEDTLKGIL